MYINTSIFTTELTLVLIVCVIIYYLSILFWNNKAHRYFKKQSKGVQNISFTQTDIPTFGGLLLITNITICNIFQVTDSSSILLYSMILFALPMIIVSSIEDFYFNVSPYLRLLSIFISALLFLVFVDFTFPSIQIPYIDSLFENNWTRYIFYSLALTTLINGMNVIDGVNGLALSTSLAALISLALISFQIGDLLIYKVSVLISLFITVMILFNYPIGKIFLGDTGAYWLGWALGILLILFYGRNQYLPSWGAILICFYPCMEIIFSFFRKILIKNNPFYPDPNHIHLKLYFLLNKKIKNKFIANNLVMPLLSIFWLLPPMLALKNYNNLNLLVISIFICLFLYILIFLFLPKVKS